MTSQYLGGHINVGSNPIRDSYLFWSLRGTSCNNIADMYAQHLLERHTVNTAQKPFITKQ